MWKKPIEDARDAIVGFREDTNGYMGRITDALERSSEFLDLLALAALFVLGSALVVQIVREMRRDG